MLEILILNTAVALLVIAVGELLGWDAYDAEVAARAVWITARRWGQRRRRARQLAAETTAYARTVYRGALSAATASSTAR